MLNRILQILKAKNISSSKFADEIGVQRSSISHILSERNKPSLELVQKILKKYPDINPNWLISGEGSFYTEPDLFSQNSDNELIKTINRNEEETFLEDNVIENNLSKLNNNTGDLHKTNLETKDSEFLKEKAQNLENKSENSEVKITQQNVNQIIDDVQIKKETLKSSTAKVVERIIIFYSDKTFTEYKPE